MVNFLLFLDSEEIIKSKKKGGKIENMSRQSIGNERVLFSEYQLIHEKEVVVKDKVSASSEMVLTYIFFMCNTLYCSIPVGD